jgi:hypothetical protein
MTTNFSLKTLAEGLIFTYPPIAWHYTTALGFLGIVGAGRINVSTVDIGANEIPVVWFSSNPVIEMTMREVALQRADGSFVRGRNAAEYRLLGCGLYRVGAPKDSLLRYVDVLKKAKIGLAKRRALEKTARQVGATPYEWFSTLEPFSLSQAVSIERFNGTSWVPFDTQDAANKVLKEQKEIMPLLEAFIKTGSLDTEASKALRLC